MCRGKVCSVCKKRRYRVDNTRINRARNQRIQYVGCPGCKHRPLNNKIVTDLVEWSPVGAEQDPPQITEIAE